MAVLNYSCRRRPTYGLASAGHPCKDEDLLEKLKLLPAATCNITSLRCFTHHFVTAKKKPNLALWRRSTHISETDPAQSSTVAHVLCKSDVKLGAAINLVCTKARNPGWHRYSWISEIKQTGTAHEHERENSAPHSSTAVANVHWDIAVAVMVVDFTASKCEAHTLHSCTSRDVVTRCPTARAD